ncbi:hypothetical protein GCM10023223_36170 [Stackebrandtia albiflava]
MQPRSAPEIDTHSTVSPWTVKSASAVLDAPKIIAKHMAATNAARENVLLNTVLSFETGVDSPIPGQRSSTEVPSESGRPWEVY